jgi:predicted deacylase
MKRITVGSAVAQSGEKIAGFIDVPAGVDPGTRIPVTIACGLHTGPALALVAGTHGAEPSPIVALQRVRDELDPLALSGVVVIVHVANLPSFIYRTIYRGPWDQKNLNRVFPGRSDGTASERIAHAITTEVIEKCDYLVDMHSGDGNEALRPYSYWSKLGIDAKVDASAREMALAYGLDHIVVDRGGPTDPSASLYCANTAHLRGKPAITAHAGGLGVPAEEAVELHYRGAFRTMRFLGILPGRKQMVEHPWWIEPFEVVASPETGVWHANTQPDETVEEGDVLGTLTDYFGETIAEVRSPLDGVVLYVVVSPSMNKDEPVAMVGKIKTERVR